ncbi:SpoIIE family protein phosphatase [Thermodesulfobacteriota bacterium]
MISEYSYVKENVEKDLRSLEKTLSSGLAKLVWEMDEESLSAIVAGIYDTSVVVGLKIERNNLDDIKLGAIIDEHNDVAFINKQGEYVDSSNKFSGIFSYTFPLVYKEYGESFKVGKMILFSSRKVILDKVKVNFSFIIVNALLTTILLCFIFYAIIQRLLARPLTLLTQAASSIEMDKLESTRVDIKTSGKTELNVLEYAFNQMIAKLNQNKIALQERAETLEKELSQRKRAENELRRYQTKLEEMVESRTEELSNKLDELARARGAMLNIMLDMEDARTTIEGALNIISGSISYASNIQQAILPDENLFSSKFSDHFIVWEPRDVVGGDIYYGVPWNNGLLLALGDCTGHGVPGAFMTLITTAALSRARSETEQVDIARIVQRMHQIVQKSLNQNIKEGTSDDGMELGVCFFDKDMTELTYVGTRFSLFIVKDGEVKEIKGDKAAVGYRGIPFDQQYTENRIKLESGQRYYMTTDGLIDQIGGPKRRSYGKKRFKNLILSLADVPFSEHGQHIYNDLIAYQGEESRRDDVSVFGFQI